ncbi:MAG TPA: DUF167 domain-containing protein [Candidatus Woesearchaeota archaeon]|nr:DUF167 domain-containing protein [Candidatus Woesearchaeota archaeon]
MRISVKVRLNKNESRLEAGESPGSYTAFIKSQPVEGKANAELIKLVKKELKCRKAPRIISGKASKNKVLEV